MDEFPPIARGPGIISDGFSFQPTNKKRTLKASSSEGRTVFIRPLEERWPAKVKRRSGRSASCSLSDLAERGGDRAAIKGGEESHATFKHQEKGLSSSLFNSKHHPDPNTVPLCNVAHAEHCPWRLSRVLQHLVRRRAFHAFGRDDAGGAEKPSCTAILCTHMSSLVKGIRYMSKHCWLRRTRAQRWSDFAAIARVDGAFRMWIGEHVCPNFVTYG